jgi:hypothetical protein
MFHQIAETVAQFADIAGVFPYYAGRFLYFVGSFLQLAIRFLHLAIRLLKHGPDFFKGKTHLGLTVGFRSHRLNNTLYLYGGQYFVFSLKIPFRPRLINAVRGNCPTVNQVRLQAPGLRPVIQSLK